MCIKNPCKWDFNILVPIKLVASNSSKSSKLTNLNSSYTV